MSGRFPRRVVASGRGRCVREVRRQANGTDWGASEKRRFAASRVVRFAERPCACERRVNNARLCASIRSTFIRSTLTGQPENSRQPLM